MSLVRNPNDPKVSAIKLVLNNFVNDPEFATDFFIQHFNPADLVSAKRLSIKAPTILQDIATLNPIEKAEVFLIYEDAIRN